VATATDWSALIKPLGGSRDRKRFAIDGTLTCRAPGWTADSITSYGRYERILDVNSYFWKWLHYGPGSNNHGQGVFFDSGGPLYKADYSISRPTGTYTWRGSTIYAYPDAQTLSTAKALYQGNQKWFEDRLTAALGLLEIIQWGTTGIARTVPTLPRFNLARFFGELREGLPRIPMKRMHPKASDNPAGEVLNFEFGWKPTLNDARGIATTYLNYFKYRDQIHEEAGKWLRRKRRLVQDSSVVVESAPNTTAYPQPTVPSLDIGRGRYSRTVHTNTNIWFVGMYSREILHQLDSWMRDLQEFCEIWGITPNMSTVYALTPWSWLAEWVLNCSDALQALSLLGSPGLRMEYGYVMVDITRTIVTKLDGYPVRNSSPGSTQVVETQRTRQRYKAYPWGFGRPTYGKFSLDQASILSALGKSRLTYR